jgi:hypothetical protein
MTSFKTSEEKDCPLNSNKGAYAFQNNLEKINFYKYSFKVFLKKE